MQNLTDLEKQILFDAIDSYLETGNKTGKNSYGRYDICKTRAKLILCFNPETVGEYNDYIIDLDEKYFDLEKPPDELNNTEALPETPAQKAGP